MADDTNGARLSRRRFLIASGAGAAAVGVPIAQRAGAAGPSSADSAPTAAQQAAAAARASLELDEIQGNIVAGFNKDRQAMLFVSIPAGRTAPARRWLGELVPQLATSQQVATFNDSYRAAKAAGTEGTLAATWINVALSHRGLRSLGRSAAELTSFPVDFRDGMRRRAGLIGDTGANAPEQWPVPYRTMVDAVVIVAADRQTDFDRAVDAQRALLMKHGLTLVHVQLGAARHDQPGHEHFGFKDGISQPGLRGFTKQENPADPGQGIPGQDLLWPGEFVLGYPRQAGPGQGDDAGPVAASGPAWTVNGSYLVFRRLTQDVAGFRSMIAAAAQSTGMSEDLVGAKIVGRYKSGAPLSLTGPQSVDPGLADPSLTADEHINDFEYEEDDADGTLVPLGAHIRKTYPRDAETEDGGEEDTQTHRVLRRGIPFGGSLAANAPAGSTAAAASFPNDRGLLFLCYQTSIEGQFEHVQRHWVNDPNFPKPGAGEDPVRALTPGVHRFAMPGTAAGHIEMMQRFVTTTGGEYFFQPSISAIRLLAGAPGPVGAAPPARTGPPAPGVPVLTRPATRPAPTAPARPAPTRPPAAEANPPRRTRPRRRRPGRHQQP